MRVLLDTSFAARAPFSGTAVYLDRLQEALEATDGVEVITASNHRRRPPAGGGPGSVRNLLADWRWTSVELPRLARRARADLIHHPLPARSRFGAHVQVVTVHDLAFERMPRFFDPKYRIYAHLAHRRAALGADAVVCVSATTASDARQLWGVSAERIVVARHGPGQGLGTARSAAGPSDPRYLLYVGDDEPRKNVSTLIAAYRLYREAVELPLELVLAGSVTRSEPGVRAELRPSPRRLAELYAGATALVHPCFYEGFGLTALEAMSAGTPVIASDAPAVLEVCGDAGRYARPDDPATFASAMAEVSHDGALRSRLAERGRRRAAEFSWAQSARAHLEAYSLALSR